MHTDHGQNNEQSGWSADKVSLRQAIDNQWLFKVVMMNNDPCTGMLCVRHGLQRVHMTTALLLHPA